VAYTPINPADIQAGKPTKEEIFDTIRSNQESFNTDIEGLKQVSTVDIFNVLFSGDINNYSLAEVTDRVPVYRAPVGATIVNFKAVLLEASTSGTLELEIEKSTDEGVNWVPLLNSPVTISGTAVGSISGAVDFTSAAAQDFNQGDLLRIKVTGVQVNQGSFHISVSGELGGS